MPGWVAAGFEEYARRLPRELELRLRPVEAPHRSRALSPVTLREEEGRALLAALPQAATTVALDQRGEPWSTEDLARRLEGWMRSGGDVALLVGGASGLAAPCLERADRAWSLSPLTLPHMLVRVVVAEQVYRAWTWLSGHPYHRAEAAPWRGERATARRGAR